MGLYWTSIAEGGPTLKQYIMLAGRRVSCRHYLYGKATVASGWQDI